MTMSLQNHSHVAFKKMSMIELANLTMSEDKKEMSFKDIFNKVATLKELSASEKEEKISQFYTDLNADGRFITNGANVWGLKKWYHKSKAGGLKVIESEVELISEADPDDEVDEYISKVEATSEDVEFDETIDDIEDDDYYDEEAEPIDGIEQDFDEAFTEDDDY